MEIASTFGPVKGKEGKGDEPDSFIGQVHPSAP